VQGKVTTHHYMVENYVQMPWKNGTGITTELARSSSVEGYDWRLSIADITADGPFSSFPDCRRIITVLEGAGMQLTVDGQSSGVLRPFKAFTFDGDSRTNCTLIDGPIRDLNLIYRKDRIDSRFKWVELSVPRHIVTAAPMVLIFTAVGRMALRHSGAGELHLGDQELAKIENNSGTLSMSLDGKDGGPGKHAAVVELWPL